MNRKLKNKGFSLLEILLVLAVAATFVIGAFLLLPKVFSGQKAQSEANHIGVIASGIKGLYTGVPYYTGITTANIVNAKIFPDDMIPDSTSTTPLNSWKGLVTIAASNESPSGATGSSFTITYPSVPAEDCVRVVAYIGTNYYIIRVNGTTVKDPENLLNAATLASTCKAGGNSNTLVITSY